MNTETLKIQPIIVPRGLRDGDLHFCVVFNFLRIDAKGNEPIYKPSGDRKNEPVTIPDCLKSTEEPWPQFIRGRMRGLRLKVCRRNALGVIEQIWTGPIAIEDPRDLKHANWTESQANQLWRSLIVPYAKDITANDRSPRSFVSTQVQQATGLTAIDFAGATAQPNAATDLRPRMILESVESGKVSELIDLGEASNGSIPAEAKLDNLITWLVNPNTPIDRFLDFLDGHSALQGWAAVLSRDDPKFKEVYLPILKKRPDFSKILDDLLSSIPEFGLNFSALEIRRQSRFIQSGRNQSTYPTLSSAQTALNQSGSSEHFVSMHRVMPEPEEKSFEEVIRKVRQHPGLMRRLSLTVHAKCSLPDGFAWTAADGPYEISLDMDVLDSPSALMTAWYQSAFVVTPTSTLCDIVKPSESDRFSCFRAAPRNRQTFVGASDKGEKESRFTQAMSAFQTHSLLSKNLVYAVQTDPSLAMARAERHIASETSRPSTEGENGEYAPNVVCRDRVHSVNFFSRYFAPFELREEIKKAALAHCLLEDDSEESVDSNGTDLKGGNNNRLKSISAAEHLQRKIRTIVDAKKEFDKTTVALAQAVNAMKQPRHLVSTTVNVVDLLNKGEPLYCAENLMAGHSLYVRGDDTDPTWRSLCRRVVEVEYTDATTGKAKTLVFEEEGFIASTVVHSPKPITGRLVSFNDSEIKVKLRAGSVDGGTEATFQLIQPPAPGSSPDYNNPPTQFACWFDSIVDRCSLRVDDQVIISPVPVPKGGATVTGPLKCESVFIHPEVHDPSGEVSKLVLSKFANFSAPKLIRVKRVHEDDGRTRSILVAPRFTRFVDTDGVEVTSQRNNGSKFNSYTVEGSLKLFSRSLGLMKDPDTCERVFYQTSEGFTRIDPADVPKDLKVAYRRIVLDPDRKFPGNANPFDVQINPEDRITLVSLGQGESLEWIRGIVTNAELVSTSWRLRVESFKGQSFIVQVANQKIKDQQIEIHPIDSQGLGVELLTRKRTTMTEAIGLPRYLLGSSVEVSNGTQLLLSDGSTIATNSSVGNQTGRFEVRWNANEPTLKFIKGKEGKKERFLVGGELRTPPIFMEEKSPCKNPNGNRHLVELFSANGDKTTVAVNGAGTVIRGFHASEGLRSVRSLQPGEYLVAYCDLNVGVHSDSVAGFWPAVDDAGSLIADTYVIGSTKSLTESAYAKSVSSANLYASATLRSDSSRDVSVWSNASRGDFGRVDVYPTFLLMLAETLAECGEPTAPAPVQSPGTAISTSVATNVESSCRGTRAVVSELICRWGNWSVTTPMPGGDEGNLKQDTEYDNRFKIKLRRPYWNDLNESRKFGPHTSGLFGRDQWQLPTLRFGKSYRFCFRQVDFAGNHLYDEQPMKGDHTEVFYLGNNERRESGLPFERAFAPSAPILAHQPGNLEPQFIQFLRSLEPKSDAVTKKGVAIPPQLSQKFDYLTSTDLEDQLVLFSDVLAPGTTLTEDSFCEVLPPPLDVETVILEGGLDKYKNPEDAIAFIRKHESYFDHAADTDGDDTPDSFVLGRLKGGGGELNYFPDNSARWLQASIDCPFTNPHSPAKPLTVPLLGKWPGTNWVRIHLAPSDQDTTEYRHLPSLFEPKNTIALSSHGITFFLPPGAEGTARLKCLSEDLSATGASQSCVLQSNERTIRLRHITNGPLVRPHWAALSEKVPELLGLIPNTRYLQAQIELHPLTSGAVSVQGYWNDCWDESVPAQFEPARAIVEVSKEGRPIAVHLMDAGFGFGSRAVVLFEEERVPIRNPKLHPILHNEKLVEFRVLDEGVGCGAVYKVTVLPACCPVSPYMCPAYATVRRNETGKLEITIDDPGRCLGTSAVARLCLCDRVFPTLLPNVVNGSIEPHIDMIVPADSRFATDLTARIVRRPPLARLAEGVVDPKRTMDGGIETVYVSEGGGWYASAPICVLVDPSGDGYGAKLVAVLNSFGEVESVSVLRPGRKYSADTRIEFYTSMIDIPETIIPLPTPTDTEAYKSFEITHEQVFPDGRARRIDFVARVSARNRELLLQEDDDPTPVTKPHDVFGQNQGLVVAPHAEPSGSLALRKIVQRHVPRFSTPLQLPAVSYLRPEKPQVAYMMPAFQWTLHDSKGVRPVDRELRLDLATEKRLRVDREAVIRVYLKRPWHASGPEKLAVVLAPAVSNSIYQEKEVGLDFPPNFLTKDAGVYNPAHPTNGGFADRRGGYVIDAAMRNLVSRIGFDPVWNEVAYPPLNADHFPDRDPFTCYEQLTETDDPNLPIIVKRPIQLALHDVHYDAAKELWYSDIKIDLTGSGVGPNGLPFVRLAIASYQPNGLPGRRLSPVTVCDMYKLIGKRRMDMRRTSPIDFDFSLAGEFDHAPISSSFPMREVKVQMTLQDRDLPPEIIAYDPPAEPAKFDRQSSNRIAEFPLEWNAVKRLYVGHFQITAEETAPTRFFGRSVYPVLHLLESEIFPVAETITDSTGTDLLMINDRPCARRLIFSAAVNIQTEKMEPAK